MDKQDLAILIALFGNALSVFLSTAALIVALSH
jgi:hypothetical protein